MIYICSLLRSGSSSVQETWSTSSSQIYGLGHLWHKYALLLGQIFTLLKMKLEELRDFLCRWVYTKRSGSLVMHWQLQPQLCSQCMEYSAFIKMMQKSLCLCAITSDTSVRKQFYSAPPIITIMLKARKQWPSN